MLKNDEVDYCTKCTVKPTVKEHMCDDCYTAHNDWLRDLVSGKTTVKDGIRIDADGYLKAKKEEGE